MRTHAFSRVGACRWNPAVEQQAQDRIHRLGQYKPIHVTRFIIAGTIEERILKLQVGPLDSAIVAARILAGQEVMCLRISSVPALHRSERLTVHCRRRSAWSLRAQWVAPRSPWQN